MPDFESGAQTKTEWNQSMRNEVTKRWIGDVPDDQVTQSCMSAVETQVALACTHIILPSPLITEREDEAQRQAEWLDASLEVCEGLEVNQPILATVAVHDAVLNDAAFSAGGFLDTVVDQVTAREGLDGVYIVIAQTGFDHPFATPIKTQRAYAHLAKAFSEAGYDTIVTNFADAFGLVCTAFGATAMATGPSQALRRLSLMDFREGGGGHAVPHFYSHKALAELATETDLDEIVKRKLLRRVEDRTRYSQALIAELSRKGSARNLPPWAESQNNLTQGHRHLVCRLATEQARLVRASSEVRVDSVRDWLETAAANMLLVRERMKPAKIKGSVAPSESWLDIVDDFFA